LRRWHDAQLLPGIVDDPNLTDADALVDPDAIVATGSFVVSDNSLQYFLADLLPDSVGPDPHD
jgi:hypothetical protein